MSESDAEQPTTGDPARTVTAPCQTCGHPVVITDEDAVRDYRPGAVVRHGEGKCPGVPAPPPGWVYELDMTIRVRPLTDVDLDPDSVDPVGHDDAVAASEVLSRVTRRSVGASHVNAALPEFVPQLNDAWEALTKFVAMADDARLSDDAIIGEAEEQ